AGRAGRQNGDQYRRREALLRFRVHVGRVNAALPAFALALDNHHICFSFFARRAKNEKQKEGKVPRPATTSGRCVRPKIARPEPCNGQHTPISTSCCASCSTESSTSWAPSLSACISTGRS